MLTSSLLQRAGYSCGYMSTLHSVPDQKAIKTKAGMGMQPQDTCRSNHELTTGRGAQSRSHFCSAKAEGKGTWPSRSIVMLTYAPAQWTAQRHHALHQRESLAAVCDQAVNPEAHPPALLAMQLHSNTVMLITADSECQRNLWASCIDQHTGLTDNRLPWLVSLLSPSSTLG